MEHATVNGEMLENRCKDIADEEVDGAEQLLVGLGHLGVVRMRIAGNIGDRQQRDAGICGTIGNGAQERGIAVGLLRTEPAGSILQQHRNPDHDARSHRSSFGGYV